MLNYEPDEHLDYSSKKLILREFKETLFSSHTKRTKNLLKDIAVENAKMQNILTERDFHYKGISYPPYIANYEITLPLHPDLEKRTDMVLGQLEQNRQAERYFLFMLRKILSLGHTCNDIHYLIPKRLRRFIMHIIPGDPKDSKADPQDKKQLIEKTEEYIKPVAVYLLTTSLIKG